MAHWRRTVAKLRNLIVNKHVDEELAREVAAHLTLLADDFQRGGMTAEEAQLAARRAYGNVEQTKQAHRDERSLLWVEQSVQDLRYGVRTLSRSPGFALTAVITLALGIGACTAIFSVFDAVLLHSLPYGNPKQLAYVYTPSPQLLRMGVPAEVFNPSFADFFDLQKQGASVAEMSLFQQTSLNIAANGKTDRVGVARVDGDFFRILQSQPEVGREINAGDLQQGSGRVALISHGLSVAMFGGTDGILDRTIRLDGEDYRVIGVMPAGFEYPHSSDLPAGFGNIARTQIWFPLSLTPQQVTCRDFCGAFTIARLRPGVTVREAEAGLSTIMGRLDSLHNPAMHDLIARLVPLLDVAVGPVKPLMRILMAAVALVLLIACGNVANLLLARGTVRTRELGVRAALGAGRGRIVRQLLTESILVGAGGCTVGIALAFLFLRLLPKMDPGNIPRLNEASLDGQVLLVALSASLLTSLVAAFMPAITASRMELTGFLKSYGVRGSSIGYNRLQSGLIVGQTAMVVVLLAGAGLLIRSYINVESVDTGFARSAVTFQVGLDQRYAKPEQRIAFNKALVARLEALPGVQAAGSVNYLPLTNSESIDMIWVEGFPNKDHQQAEGRDVTPHYFSAMNIPLIAGRYFTDADASVKVNRPVIINQKFAETFFANRNPIGGRITGDPKLGRWWTVVGVVADVRHASLEQAPQLQMYHASYDAWNAGVAVRSDLPPSTVASEIRMTLKSMDPNLAATEIQTMGDLISTSTARRRFQTSLLAVFAGIALLMALVGLWGLMTFFVNQRFREVGVRMALGAKRRDVLLLILRRAFALLACGLGLGLASMWITTRVLKSFLFGVGQHDPFTVSAVSVLLVVSGLMAALVPARRAASTDPMQALRTE